MSFIRIFSFIVFLVICVGSHGEEYRTFTGTNGRKIEARFVSFDEEKQTVKIVLKDGREQTVLLSLFCDKDKEFIQNDGKTDNPFAESIVAPKILKIEPPNGSKNLDPEQTKTIIVTFDRDMDHGFSYCRVPNKERPKATTKWLDKKTFRIKVDLEPDTEYGISFNDTGWMNFKSIEGASLEPVVYTLSTRKLTDFAVKMGKREVFMRNNQYQLPNHSLCCFPELQIGFLQYTPKVRLLMTVGAQTWLFEGNDLWSLVPIKSVLVPGPPNSIDNSYIGASSVLHDPKNKKRVLAFCHTEDHRDLPKSECNNVPGFYATVFLAESFDEGHSFRKIGPVITSNVSKTIDLQNTDLRECQGSGDPCVIFDKEKKHYLAYYMEWSEYKKRGVQICLARCAVTDGGLPGKWRKYHEGEFKEPGLGGKDTPIVSAWNQGDAIDATVVYVKSIDKYVMLHCVMNGKESDWKGATVSGFYVRISDDGIHWSKPKQIAVGYPVPATGIEFMGRPTLVPIKTSQTGFQGYVLYTYSEKWGPFPTYIPHYFVGQPISFTIQ